MDDIREAEYSKATLYVYFQSKEDQKPFSSAVWAGRFEAIESQATGIRPTKIYRSIAFRKSHRL